MRAIDLFSESFVHKRFFGAAKGLLSGGGITGALTGFFGGGGSPVSIGQIPNSIIPGRDFVNQPGCTPPFVRDQSGICVLSGSPADISTGPSGGGVAVVRPGGVDGQLPSARTSRTLVCPPGMVLSKDDRCFHSLTKKERKWNPGRRPLLTGGERNAITKAAAAARKIQRTEKQLQKLGMLKKPTARRAPRRHGASPTHQLTSSDPGVRIISVGE